MATNTVRIGSRDVAVEQSPLHVGYLAAGAHDKFVLSQPADGQLKLMPSRGVRVLGWIFCVLGVPVLILGLISIFGLMKEPTGGNLLAVAFLLVWGCPFTIFGVKLLGQRTRFDTNAGEVATRFLWRTRRRPLADVLAVQVINAGKFGADDEKFVSYQLNLVLDDANEPRLFVVFNTDLADMAKKAKLVADFLSVPLLTWTRKAEKADNDSSQDSNSPIGDRADPTRHWAKKHEPMPPFDLETGALGTLTWDHDCLEKAEFLGRPDRVEHFDDLGEMTLYYLERGFEVSFMPEFAELVCHIAPPTDVPPDHGQGFCRPRLSGGIELTTETSITKVRELFGPPKSEHLSPQDNTLTLVYLHGRFHMEFEFEQETGRLMTWTIPL